MKLDGRVAVVTGAASGIGRSMARRFAAEGAKLVLADLSEGRLAKVASALSDSGAAVKTVLIDVRDSAQVEQMINTAVEAFGRLDVLCNNAGVLDDLTPVHDTSDELFERVMGVNLQGPFMACRKALPIMVEQGSGTIINTASAAGLHGGRGGAIYTASKHAVVGLTKSIAWYYGPKGIRCNAIAPGMVLTKMAGSMTNPHTGGMERYSPYFSQIPGAGKATQIADVAVFLASDDSSYVNGAVIPVDGGWIAY